MSSEVQAFIAKAQDSLAASKLAEPMPIGLDDLLRVENSLLEILLINDVPSRQSRYQPI